MCITSSYATFSALMMKRYRSPKIRLERILILRSQLSSEEHFSLILASERDCSVQFSGPRSSTLLSSTVVRRTCPGHRADACGRAPGLSTPSNGQKALKRAVNAIIVFPFGALVACRTCPWLCTAYRLPAGPRQQQLLHADLRQAPQLPVSSQPWKIWRHLS